MVQVVVLVVGVVGFVAFPLVLGALLAAVEAKAGCYIQHQEMYRARVDQPGRVAWGDDSRGDWWEERRAPQHGDGGYYCYCYDLH